MSQIKEHKSITTLQRIIAYVADDHSIAILEELSTRVVSTGTATAG